MKPYLCLCAILVWSGGCGGDDDDTAPPPPDGGSDGAGMDGAVNDAPVADGGGGGDSMGMCPQAPSMVDFDPTGLTCEQLQDMYGGFVQSALVCGCDDDCSQVVCDSLCCNCSVFVNPGNDAYNAASAISVEWNTRVMNGACIPPPCPAIACPGPVSGGCGDVGGSTTVCITN